MYKKIFSVIIIFAFAMVAGCATTPTKSQYIAGAKAIAREAGNLVAMNNPKMAAEVKLVYNMIKDDDGDEFRALFANGLQQMLEAEGVAGSSRLAQSAVDLMAAFGLDVPKTDMINAKYLEKFAIEDIKTIAEAFIEGMAGALPDDQSGITDCFDLDGFRGDLVATLRKSRAEFKLEHADQINELTWPAR
jgi:hypothetical protein